MARVTLVAALVLCMAAVAAAQGRDMYDRLSAEASVAAEAVMHGMSGDMPERTPEVTPMSEEAISTGADEFVGPMVDLDMPEASSDVGGVTSKRPVLVVYEAGMDGAVGPVLSDGMVYCPDEYEAGFSIFCNPAADVAAQVSTVEFYVNGVFVRREHVSPYTIASNGGTQVEPWTDYERFAAGARIECRPDVGESTTVNVMFSCDISASPAAMPMVTDPIVPTTMTEPFDAPASTTVPMDDNPAPEPAFEPREFPRELTTSPALDPTPNPSTSPLAPPMTSTGNREPMSEPEPMLSASPMPSASSEPEPTRSPIPSPSSSADPEPTPEPKRSPGPSPSSSAEPEPTPAPTRSLEPSPSSSSDPEPTKTPSPSQSSSSRPEPTPEVKEPEKEPETESGDDMTPNSDGCVVINVKDAPPSDGWVVREDGLEYKPEGGGEVDDAGLAELKYTFKAPVTGHYAVTLDMTTETDAPGFGTEHNDVFLQFPSGDGFLLKKDGEDDEAGGTDYRKAYHNKSGRAVEAKTVDNVGKSFSTADVLDAGKEYPVNLSGRSTQTLLHKIIMFPCEGDQCKDSSAYWKGMISKCT